MKLIKDTSKEKLRGCFYTPENIASFILRWAINGNKNYDILEPSCGDGVFLEMIQKNNFNYKSVKAIELDSKELGKAKRIKLKNCEVFNKDFYSYCNSTKERFDIVVGNPPYIRYQYFDKIQRKEAEKIFLRAGLKYSKLTNAWVSFVVGASLLLRKKGKIAFVLPAEILQVSYAKQLRNFLAHFYNKINIVSFKKLVFPNIQQEVVLLLCEKDGSKNHLIEHLEVEDAQKLKNLDINKLKSPKKKIDFKSNKWTFYFLNQKEINFLEKLMNQKKILPLRHYAKVEVGITTGANSFFRISNQKIKKYNLEKFAKPLAGKNLQIPGIIFTKEDWKKSALKEKSNSLLDFPTKKILKNNILAQKYLKEGEKNGFNKGYKCGIRKEWQIMPSKWISEALFTRRNNINSKFIINNAKTYALDNFHRITITNPSVNPYALIASYYNSLSFAFTELFGRSHGGGVLELMPNETGEILIPYKPKNKNLIKEIDLMMREGININDILKKTDKIILGKEFGFSKKEIKLANNIWKKLLNRRLNRKKLK